jgi:hypothetical protein
VTKQSGLGDNLLVGGYDISGDIGSLSRIGGGPALLEVPDIAHSGMARNAGKRSGAIEFASWFDDAAGMAHEVLSALPTADTHVMYLRGTALGGAGAVQISKMVGYDPSLGADGSLSQATSAQSNGYGLEWGIQHTAGQRTDTGATNGTGVDGGDATSYGLQAYLQVVSFTGTDATIKIQESSDDGSADAYDDVTGGAFTEITSAPATERIATATDLAVEQYLRVVTTTSGGFSEMTFVVVVVRNLTIPEF